MLQRPAAWVLERYLSSRSPPDHLLYQMLKIVPVWGGGSDFIVDGSTCGRAGLRFLRMIFLVFLTSGSPWLFSTSSLSGSVIVRSVDGVMVDCCGGSVRSWSDEGVIAGGEISTSVMMSMDIVCKNKLRLERDLREVRFLRQEDQN